MGLVQINWCMTIALASIGRRRIEEVKSSKFTEKLFIKSTYFKIYFLFVGLVQINWCMTIALAPIGRRRIEDVKSSKLTEKLSIKSISN